MHNFKIPSPPLCLTESNGDFEIMVVLDHSNRLSDTEFSILRRQCETQMRILYGILEMPVSPTGGYYSRR